MPTYIRLTDYKDSDSKEEGFFKPENRYEGKQEDFEKIPGSPIAYWVSDRVKEIFENDNLNDISIIRQGTATGDTERFIRKWFEISKEKLFLQALNCENAVESGYKWFPITKGGVFRRFFGNNEDVISFDKNNFNYEKELSKKMIKRIEQESKVEQKIENNLPPKIINGGWKNNNGK